MKILILDDERIVRRALFLGLQNRGHQLVEAKHPAEALKKIQEEIFDLLILDYNMSLLSGLDFIKILNIRKKNMQVVFLTSFDFSIESTPEYDLKPDQILSKDEPISELIASIENFIKTNINH